MKKIWPALLSSVVLMNACGKGSRDDRAPETNDIAPGPSLVSGENQGLHVFRKADEFSMPENASWAYTFDNENPTFNMALYCGTPEGHCLNDLIDAGKVVLETTGVVNTAGPTDLELTVQYSGWASKYTADESEFASQSFFSVRLVYNMKNESGQSEERFQDFVLPLRDISQASIKPWQGAEKNIVYSSGNQDIFTMKARIGAQVDNMKVQIFDVGASILQIQKIEVKF